MMTPLRQDQCLGLAHAALGALCIFLVRRELPAAPNGAFLLHPAATLFWAGVWGVVVAALGGAQLHESDPRRVASLASAHLCLAHALLYGGAMTYWEFGPSSSYASALAASLLAAAPAVYRLWRGERARAVAALGGVAVVLGAALCYLGVAPTGRLPSDAAMAPPGHGGGGLAVAAGAGQVLAGGAAALASATRQPRALNANKAACGLSTLLLGCTAAASSAHSAGLTRNALISVAAGLGLFNAIAASITAARLRVVALAPASPPQPLAGRTRFFEVTAEQEAGDAAPTLPLSVPEPSLTPLQLTGRTRYMELAREAAAAERADAGV
jgi:hypothetical protein